MDNLKGNIYGGVTAAVVALPLALAFGVSSGAGAAAGLYGAIFVGFFAALFGGTQTQISGPTGPMTVVMAVVITQFIGSNPEQGLALAFATVILGGFFQIIFGLIRIGKYIILVPYPVISGFMSGIGVIIIILQIGPILGHTAGASVLTVLTSIPAMVSDPNITALILGVITLVVVNFWPSKLERIIPGPLAALIIGTLSYLVIFPNVDISRIGAIELGLPSLQLPYIELSYIPEMIKYALMLGGLGAIDSLLTSLVADSMTGTKHNSDRELIGQGIGNMVAGAFGTLPGAGATMRTAININTGGTTKLSGIIHALLLLVIALGAGSLVENIPYAVLAGILIYVGISIIDWSFIRHLHRVPLFPMMLMISVLLLTVFYDLMTAVILGVFITNLVTIDRLSQLQLKGITLTDGDKNNQNLDVLEKDLLQDTKGSVLLFEFDGALSFGVAHNIKPQLENFSSHQSLILDFSKAAVVGITILLVIEDIIRSELKANRTVYITGLDEELTTTLNNLGILDLIPEECCIQSRLDALKVATN